jgi:hypothetical protein
MTRVYHLWLTTRILQVNANKGNPVVPVTPITIDSANVNNVTWAVNWDDLFKRENKNYKRCTLRFQLNSVGFTRTDTDWGDYNGVLTCNLGSNSVGITTFGTPLGMFSISYASGKQLTNPILISNGNIHFGYTSYF